MTNPDPRDDVKISVALAWLKRKGLQAHSDRKGNLAFFKRVKKFSRLTGEPR